MPRNLVMSALVLATVLASLDSSFVPLAFPDLIDDLDTSTGVVVWVALGYLVAATGPMPYLARLGDRLGHAMIYRLGIVVYSAAMTLCAWAGDITALIALRLVQGLGMALFLPATFSIAVRVYPAEQRGRALGVLAAANAFGFILGPIFAGWMLDAYDWRAIFASRIPVAALVLVLGFLAVRSPPGTGQERSLRGLDHAGAIFLTLGSFGILYGLNRLPVEDNHLDPSVWTVFVAGWLALVLFVWQERRSADPLIDFSLFTRSADFTRACLAFTVLFASFPIYLFLLPLLLLNGLEYRAWDAGMLLAVVALLTFFISPLAGKLADRMGAQPIASAGAFLILAGYLAMLAVDAGSGTATLLVPMILIGAGTGLFFSPNNSLIMSNVPPERSGMASGLIGTLRQSGYALGFAVMASLFTVLQNGFERTWTRRSLVPGTEPLAHTLDEGGIWSPEALVYIFHVAAILCGALVLVVAVYSLPRLRLVGRWHLLPAAAALAALGAGWTVYVRGSELRLELGKTAGATIAAPEAPAPAAPFGMTSRRPKELPPPGPPIPVTAEEAARLGPLVAGRRVFLTYCASCHDADARGARGVGKSIVQNDFVKRHSDEELIDFLRRGRAPEATDNTTGRLMPSMTTFPDFREESYAEVIAYVRSLNRGI